MDLFHNRNPSVRQLQTSTVALFAPFSRTSRLKIRELQRRLLNLAVESDFIGITITCTQEDIVRWSVSLEQIMQDAVGLQEFMHYLKKEYSLENIRFWLTVCNYKLMSYTEIRQIARQIYAEFLAPGAPSEINIDGHTRDKVEQDLIAPTRKTFDVAACHVYSFLLKKDCYPRFIRSDQYKDLLLHGTKKLSKPTEELIRECKAAVMLIKMIKLAPMEDDVFPWESLGMTLPIESFSGESDEGQLLQECQGSNESRSDSVASRIRRSFCLGNRARSSSAADKSPKIRSKSQAPKKSEPLDGQSSSSTSPVQSTSKASSLPSSPQHGKTATSNTDKHIRTKLFSLSLAKKRTVAGNGPLASIEIDKTSSAVFAAAQTAAAVVTCIGAGSGRKPSDSIKLEQNAKPESSKN